MNPANVPVWNAAFQNSSSVGGLLYGALSPLGGFGKFLTVLVAPTMYTFSTSLMSIARWFSIVPRWVYSLVSEAIYVYFFESNGPNPQFKPGLQPDSRRHRRRLQVLHDTTFVDILSSHPILAGVIGYCCAAFASIVITDHVLFRGASFSESAYPVAAWDVPGLLPQSIPAVLASICACGALVPFISQAWYVGPVVEAGSGDCGIYIAFVVSALGYALLRGLERRWDMRQEGEAIVREVEDGLG